MPRLASLILWVLLTSQVVAVGITSRAGSENPIRVGQLAWLDVEGLTPEQLKGAALHFRPAKDLTAIPGVGWDGKPYILVQGAAGGEFWVAVCVAVEAGKIETSEYIVQVGSGPSPGPDPPAPNPEPPTPPEPPAPPDGDLTQWVATQAAGAGLPKDIAERWAVAIEGVLKLGLGEFESTREFRETLRSECHRALGFELWAEWNDKFDDPILTPRLEKEIAAGGDTVATYFDVWGKIAKGLRQHSGKTGLVKAADPRAIPQLVQHPVAMVMFSSPGCAPCKMMRPLLDRMHQDGYRVFVTDISEPRNQGIAAKCGVRVVPHFTMTINGVPWEHFVGATDEETLRQWYARAQQEAAKAGR